MIISSRYGDGVKPICIGNGAGFQFGDIDCGADQGFSGFHIYDISTDRVI